MPAIGFKKQFAKLIESGEKTQTYRQEGWKNLVQVGDRITLYTGLRTKKCRKLGDGIVRSVDAALWVGMPKNSGPGRLYVHDGIIKSPYIPGQILMADEDEAQADGFRDLDCFLRFFQDIYGDGMLHMVRIKWRILKKGESR